MVLQEEFSSIYDNLKSIEDPAQFKEKYLALSKENKAKFWTTRIGDFSNQRFVSQELKAKLDILKNEIEPSFFSGVYPRHSLIEMEKRWAKELLPLMEKSTA